MMALPRGTIRATVLIETILAAFEMVGGLMGSFGGGEVAGFGAHWQRQQARGLGGWGAWDAVATPSPQYPTKHPQKPNHTPQEEIIFELREHSAGLNCGRWDYIFS
jgi:hypothetical protein